MTIAGKASPGPCWSTCWRKRRPRGYARLSLETGAQEAFAPARALYAAYGFRPCPPFAHYREDPNSVFLSRLLHP